MCSHDGTVTNLHTAQNDEHNGIVMLNVARVKCQDVFDTMYNAV